MIGNRRPNTRWRRWIAVVTVAAATVIGIPIAAQPAAAAVHVPITAGGSTWSLGAMNAWTANIRQFGVVVSYSGAGSTTGRNNFKSGLWDFGGSDIPYGVQDGTNFDPPPGRGFAYMPDTAGGTTFMYNLKIGNRRVTNLRLSGPVIAGIFTGTITSWADPRIKKDNPGLALPATTIVPVVRSDGSGATAQFTQWMLATQRSSWTAYCAKVGRSPCTQTSAYPVLPGSHMVGQSGDPGVSGYVSQAGNVGSIGYVEYAFAIESGFPVAKMLNSAGFYTEPTAGHVAVSLLNAKINMDKSDPNTYLTQNLAQVYVDRDPRTYPLSSYSYMILPTTSANGFNANKGFTLGDFGKYVVCQGQSSVDALGYSALPINLAEASFDQLSKIPGAATGTLNIASCDNPTFSETGVNTLAKNDPSPPACDHEGPTQCTTGTGGAIKVSTPVSANARGKGDTGSDSGATRNAANGKAAAKTTGPGGTSAAGAGASAANCDPDSQDCDVTGASAADVGQVIASPVNTAANISDGMQVALMVLAAALLVGLGLAPPLIVQANRRRRGGER
jgi:phosphate ABC transporter phosphate-binding protein